MKHIEAENILTPILMKFARNSVNFDKDQICDK